jgi:tripartite ATP-independent transporter DctM subunit
MLIGLALGIHAGIIFGLVGFGGTIALLGFSKSLSMMATTPFWSVADYKLLVIAMFILMGELAFQGGLGPVIFTAVSKWMGRLHGGMAMATTAACAFFGAISGSSMAAMLVFSKMAIPEMMQRGYSKVLAGGVVAASGTLAVLIPPSGTMVLYCIFTEVSLGRLMIAGVIPGILSAVIYMVSIYIRARINPDLGPPSTEVVTWKERVYATRWVAPVIIVMVIMLGGIYMGIFSPMESGAIGAFTVFIVTLIRRSLSMSALKESLRNTGRVVGMMFFMIIGAMIFSKFIALSNLPNGITMFVAGLPIPPIGILVIVLLIYIVLGCFMPIITTIVITLPIFFPLLTSLGFDGVWLGILIIKMVEIGVITPPMGMQVYIMAGVVGNDISVPTLFRGILPFFVMDVLTVVVLVAFPQISLWLPSTMY